MSILAIDPGPVQSTWADCDFLIREHVRDLCDKAMEETMPESEREQA